MKIDQNAISVVRGLQALETELKIAEKRVANPFTSTGVALPEKVTKFNEDTLARLKSIQTAFNILMQE